MKRNIILFALSLLFIASHIIFSKMIIVDKNIQILELESQHKETNEKYITAQILSNQLDQVYNIFENNLALSKNDDLNKEASMEFLKELTDIMEKIDIKVSQIIPGKKQKKGILINVPYVLQFECDFEKLGRLVVLLESNNRIITIDNILMKNESERLKLAKNNNIAYLNQKIEMKIYTTTLNKTKSL